jgi:peptidoglycan/xylan/chitin deacetylase (PgdA/CDA1 family)
LAKITHALSITVDIEDWYHIPSVTGSPFSQYPDVDSFFENWESRYDFISIPTRKILEILNNLHVNATFFIVADIIEHYPELVETIVNEGHEIACHGLHHACNIDPETKSHLFNDHIFSERTIRAKKLLESISGEPVLGYRAPNAYIGGWMINILEDLGFKYDSSICVNSLYNKTDSNLDGVSSAPYYPEYDGLRAIPHRNFLEFPWAFWEILGLKIPTSGGPALRFFGAQIIKNGLMQSLNRGSTIFYFHPLDISNEKFPRIGHKRPFYWVIKGKIIEDRIIHIINYFKNRKTPIKELREVIIDYL